MNATTLAIQTCATEGPSVPGQEGNDPVPARIYRPGSSPASTQDLFSDEDIALPQRMLAFRGTAEVRVHPGTRHASELFAPEAELSKHIWSTGFRALRRALSI